MNKPCDLIAQNCNPENDLNPQTDKSEHRRKSIGSRAQCDSSSGRGRRDRSFEVSILGYK